MKKFLSSPIATVALFALAAVLLGFGGINAIQAAPRIESADYKAQVKLSNINVSIVENGKVVDQSPEVKEPLLTNLLELAGDKQLVIGKIYPEELKVRNIRHAESQNEGEGIPEFVRVSVYRYWTDENGKAVNLNPALIKLHFVDDNGWTIDKDASTPERTVLYYKHIVDPYIEGETSNQNNETPTWDTTPFVDSICIDSAVQTAISNGNFDYENVEFHLKVTTDAVQTHNGTEAMVSAWGRTNE
jgi:hypothetical protein